MRRNDEILFSSDVSKALMKLAVPLSDLLDTYPTETVFEATCAALANIISTAAVINNQDVGGLLNRSVEITKNYLIALEVLEEAIEER